VCVLQANGVIVEVEPLCVLDFYVHEGYQRQGVGKALFEVSQQGNRARRAVVMTAGY
jgi:GNAT superfamily N-acetyltransferase